MCVYIYIEREREICIYIYIYTLSIYCRSITIYVGLCIVLALPVCCMIYDVCYVFMF